MSKNLTNGGGALIRALADENIDLIFGYPGGAALHITTQFINKMKFNTFQ